MRIESIISQIKQNKTSNNYVEKGFKFDKNVSFGATLTEPFDKFYKIALQKGLRDNFDLSCKLEDLNSVAGPFELKKIINNLTSRDYELGPKTGVRFRGEDAHEYAVDGTFRANFHLHSKVSDGHATPKEILEMCTAYANKVARKFGNKEKIPPFSASLTDHNKFSGNVDIIKEIVQNPKEYENFKFVVGSEFYFNGYKPPYTAFEAVGLGFNPFDKALNETASKVKDVPNSMSFTKTVKDAGGVLSLAHPFLFRDRLNNDFFKFLKDNGIGGVEGNYQYCGYEYYDELVESINKAKELAKEHGMFLTGGTDSHQKQIFGYLGSEKEDLLNRILYK